MSKVFGGAMSGVLGPDPASLNSVGDLRAVTTVPSPIVRSYFPAS